MGEIFPLEHDDDNRITVLQEFMGLTLFPNQMRHEKFLITVGHGANGKSTILRVWERMLGIAEQRVTDEQRDIGKQVNFAIIYGMDEDELGIRPAKRKLLGTCRTAPRREANPSYMPHSKE